MRDRFIAFGIALALIVLPVALVACAIWLSDHTHEFGPFDPRYFLLVSRTTVDRLDLLAPVAGSIVYAARGRDGNSPASVQLTFKTQQPPEHVIDTYRARCHALRLVTKMQEGAVARIECSSRQGDEIGITEERHGTLTEVRVGGWVF